MRKFGALACALLLISVLIYAQPGRVSESLREWLGKAALPFKVAALYGREPERQLPVPVEGVGVKQITDSWHAPRSGGRLHKGLDIFAKRGAAIYSVTEGYVLRVGENQLGGKTVTVIGAGGRSYYYAHLDDYASGLDGGDYVTQGTVLGFVGNTGNAVDTPPHLHFGIYTANGAINPLPLLTDKSTFEKE